MYSREEVKAITDKVLNMASAEAAEVDFSGGERSATRFANSTITANMVQFDQQVYGASPFFNSMDTTGYVYVPPQCGTPVRVSGQSTHSIELRNATARCHLHMNWHGCLQQASPASFPRLRSWITSACPTPSPHPSEPHDQIQS